MIPIELVLKDIKLSLNANIVRLPSPSEIGKLLSTTSPNVPPHKPATLDNTSSAQIDSPQNELHRNPVAVSTEESTRRQKGPSATRAFLKMISGIRKAPVVIPCNSALMIACKDGTPIVERIKNLRKAREARRQLMWNTKGSESKEQDKGPSFAETNSKVPEEQHAEQIRKTIESKMKKNWENKKYISRSDLEAIFTESTIRTLISEDESLHHGEFEIAQHGCAVNANAMTNEILTSASRLLALCVYVGLPLSCLHSLMGRGITDLYLPLSEADCPDPKYAIRWGFLTMMQGGFLAHRFDDDIGISKYRQLDSNIVLPIMFNEHNDRIGEGSFGVVHKVSIDPDHHSFSSDRTITFALKRFFEQGQRTKDDFARESRMLQMLSQVPSPHITPHLASWAQNDKFYVLFPRAECNLRTYLRYNMPLVLDKQLVIWLLSQLRGLADAVQHIHNLGSLSLRPATMSTEDHRGEKFDYTSFHHDIKLENILVFVDGSNAYGTLKIADFGSGKLGRALPGNSGISQESYFTHNLGDGDEAYEAPDRTIEGRTSRPYDMWSLGCVFLEIISCLFQTEKSDLDDFASARRKTPDITRHSSLAFWYLDSDCKVRLKPAVVDKLAHLNSLCSGKRAFERLVRSISKMLTLSPSDRITAPELCNELHAIQIQAEMDMRDNPEHYLRLSRTHRGPSGSDAAGTNKPVQCSFDAGGEDDTGRFTGDTNYPCLRDEEIDLDIVNETVNQDKILSERGLGQVVQEGLLKERRKYGEEMEKLKELNQAAIDTGDERRATFFAGMPEEIQKKEREQQRSTTILNTNFGTRNRNVVDFECTTNPAQTHAGTAKLRPLESETRPWCSLQQTLRHPDAETARHNLAWFRNQLASPDTRADTYSSGNDDDAKSDYSELIFEDESDAKAARQCVILVAFDPDLGQPVFFYGICDTGADLNIISYAKARLVAPDDTSNDFSNVGVRTIDVLGGSVTVHGPIWVTFCLRNTSGHRTRYRAAFYVLPESYGESCFDALLNIRLAQRLRLVEIQRHSTVEVKTPQAPNIHNASHLEPPFLIDLGFFTLIGEVQNIRVTVDYSMLVNVVTNKCLKELGFEPLQHALPSHLGNAAMELPGHCGWQRLNLFVTGYYSREIEFLVVSDDYGCDLLLGREFKEVKLNPRAGAYPNFAKPKDKGTLTRVQRQAREVEVAAERKFAARLEECEERTRYGTSKPRVKREMGISYSTLSVATTVAC
jgi:serine/threonine protein kinase